MQFRPIAKLVRLPKQRSFAAGLAGSAAELAPRVMRRQPLLLAFLCAVVLLAAVPALANPTVAEKRAEAGQVLAQVQQLDASLAQVIQAYDLATERLNRVQRALRENGKNLAIARGSLKRGTTSICGAADGDLHVRGRKLRTRGPPRRNESR